MTDDLHLISRTQVLRRPGSPLDGRFREKGRIFGFKGGDGIVMKDIETTIKGIGRLGKDGMRQTNEEIIRLMMS